MFFDLFNTEQGKLILEDLKKRTFEDAKVEISPDHQNLDLALAFNEGRRSLLKDVIKRINEGGKRDE